MRLQTAQIVLALMAAVAFVLAFLAAGAVLISGLFMVAGLALLGLLAWTLIKRVLFRGRLAAARGRRHPA